jgi:MATE family multidrug resistance protein
MIGWFPGDDAVIGRSAHQIALNVISATYMIMLGLSVAGSIKVGEAYGAGNPVEIKRAGAIAMKLALLIIASSAVGLLFFSHIFTKLYGIEDILVTKVTIRLMQIAAVFQIFDGIQCISAGLLRGIQDVKIPTIITFAAYWVIWIPLAYWMGFTLNMGVDGIWYADLIALAIAAALLSWRFFSSRKLKLSYYL